MNRPKVKTNIDWDGVINMCEEHITDSENNEAREDNDHYIYEEILKAIYGNEVFDYLNEICD